MLIQVYNRKHLNNLISSIPQRVLENGLEHEQCQIMGLENFVEKNSFSFAAEVEKVFPEH